MHKKANGTFLWVALVFQELEQVDSWDVLEVVEEVPPGLPPLYHRMMTQIQRLKRQDPEYCRLVLSTMTLAYRPLHLAELGTISGLPAQIANNFGNITKIIGKCGSMLTIRGDYIYFIHQSAKDYLNSNTTDQIFPSGRGVSHYNIFFQSLQAMSTLLRRDMYDMSQPGISIELVKPPHLDPLVPLRYSCVFWVNHLEEACRDIPNLPSRSCLIRGGELHLFLQERFLYWLEALSLEKSMSTSIHSINTLLTLLNSDESHVLAIIRDAHRFILYNKSVMENYPLQIYASALMFSPTDSIIKKLYKHEEPKWITMLSDIEGDWGPCLQTLNGHSSRVLDVTFSHDSKLLASASVDHMVRLWDLITGAVETLQGHSATVRAVAFSPDDKLLASASDDKTVRLWNPTTGAVKILKGHTALIEKIAFSQDSRLLASASRDRTIRLWDLLTGEVKTLEGHTNSVIPVAFSQDGKLLASGSSDNTARLWDRLTGTTKHILMGHTEEVRTLIFSQDSKLLVSFSYKSVKLWNPMTGTGNPLFTEESGYISAIAFSLDGKLLASASGDWTVKLWDPIAGTVKRILIGHNDRVTKMVLSQDGKLLVSTSYDLTVRLWDTMTGKTKHVFDDHTGVVDGLALSQDDKLIASGSWDMSIRLWDPTKEMSEIKRIAKSDTGWITAVVFSQDGKLLASAVGAITICDPMTGMRSKYFMVSADRTVKLWDVMPGARLAKQTLDNHTDQVNAMIFSKDGKLLVSGSADRTIKLWDMTTGLAVLKQTLNDHSEWVRTVVFSKDDMLLASASEDGVVMLWDMAAEPVVGKTLKSHMESVRAAAVGSSPDSNLLEPPTDDETVQLWDPKPRTTILRDSESWLSAIAFSPDGKLLAMASLGGRVQLCNLTREWRRR